MYTENFVKILNQSDDDIDTYAHTWFGVGDEGSKFCVATLCRDVQCNKCPFNTLENFEKFKQELNEKVIPILKLQNMIEE
jgi:hypothetical protein